VCKANTTNNEKNREISLNRKLTAQLLNPLFSYTQKINKSTKLVAARTLHESLGALRIRKAVKENTRDKIASTLQPKYPAILSDKETISEINKPIKTPPRTSTG
jgi:hypothetical protein